MLLTNVAGAVFKIPKDTAEPFRLTFDEIHAIIASAQKAATSNDLPVDPRAEWERIALEQSDVEDRGWHRAHRGGAAYLRHLGSR